MKSFAPLDIKARYVNYLKNLTGWKRILQNSAIDSLLSATSETESEMVRYFEYCLKEAKWQYAQNLSSILGMADYLGYTPHRKTSAIGEIIVSHDSLLANAGVTFFEEDLDTLSEYAGTPFSIPIGTIFENGGIQCIATSSLSYPVGTKYVRVPVIQGIQSTIITTDQPALGNSFERIRINSDEIEDARDTVSSQFFSVSVRLFINGSLSPTSTPCTQVENILLAGEDEYAYEIIVAKDYSYIELLFGNNVSGRILPAGSIVTVNYLKTLGIEGNIEEKYQVNTIVSTLYDTLSNPMDGLVFCSNFSAIIGGKDDDTIEDIRANAPSEYLTEGSIVTQTQYEKAIESIPYISKAKVYGDVYYDPISDINRDVIEYTAINTLGESAGASSLNDVVDRIGDNKSPLDVLHYVDPTIIKTHVNIVGKTPAKEAQNLDILQTNITTAIYDTYNIFKLGFTKGIDHSEMIEYVRNYAGVNNVDIYFEAVTTLMPSDFSLNLVGSHYLKTFSFDPSFLKLKKFSEDSDGVLHCLKIQLKFNCPSCEEKNRTLFLIRNENYDPDDPLSKQYKLVQYPYISRITNPDYMKNYVLDPTKDPQEIVEGDVVPYQWYDFRVDFDFDSELGNGTFYIPSMGYVDWGDPSILDEVFSIQVMADLFYKDISITDNITILDIDENDISTEVSYN